MLEKKLNKAKFSIGEVVRHRLFDFRGVIYDVDFQFNNSLQLAVQRLPIIYLI